MEIGKLFSYLLYCRLINKLVFREDLLEPDLTKHVNLSMQMLITIVIMGLAIAGLSLGLFFKRKPISGHCGGGQRITVKGELLTCPTCDGDAEKCENKSS